MSMELRPVGLQTHAWGQVCVTVYMYLLFYCIYSGFMTISGMHAGGAEAGRSADPMPGDLPQPHQPRCGWAQLASAGPQVSTEI